MKSNMGFSKKDDKILINYVHRPGIKRYDMEIYNKISREYGKHSPYAWHDYYRFVLEPKLGPISLIKESIRVDLDSINNNLMIEKDFNNDSISSEYFENGFTSEEDYSLINFIQKSNLPHKGRLVFEKFHNLYPYRSCISWRNRYVNILLPLLNANCGSNYNSEVTSPGNISDKSKKYLYDANKNLSDSMNLKAPLNSDILFYSKSDHCDIMHGSFTNSTEESLPYKMFQTYFHKPLEVTLNCVKSTSKYDYNFNKDKDLERTYSSTTNHIHDPKNTSIIEQFDSSDNSLILPKISINKEIDLKISLPLKRKKSSEEFLYNNLKDDKLVPDEDDIMMLRQLTMQMNPEGYLLEEQKKMDQISSIFDDKNIKNISEQGCSTPTNTDEISYLSTIVVESISPQSQINYNLQTPKSLSSSTSTLYLDKEILRASTSPNLSDDNISIQNYQEISKSSEFNINHNFLSNSMVLNNDIQNINSYDNLKSNDLMLGESDTLLEKTAHWYLRNMKKYGITQNDVTFALYKTSGVKKLAVIVMEAISRNLPLPNIEGIWTEEDDLVVYSGTSKQLKQINQKHGGKLHNRIKFLQDYLEANYADVDIPIK
ncbi:uncharacterized protein T551_01085 [Pneumocystis jirovecii RU7]|uniref:DNA-binding protein RAP1 n=1 Tax=Pneumocystis jirovecii (strain RU7) TaxID=1408657 RepID=A0A0W4ZU19_PNEJ7|nr:uncharacterized protein T551_01085 [Pneumocystis jirovecii RU7]KTW31824.1 hypothetical protein T551_01085 [Pneumocystis jirovecii RU7]